MSELGMDRFVAVEQPAKLAALEDEKSIPEELETALVQAQMGMKKEVKALCMFPSHATLENIS